MSPHEPPCPGNRPGSRPRWRASSPGARTRAGFTLLEIMMAVSILGFSLVIILDSIRHSVSMYRSARDHVIATMAARKLLEETVAGLGETTLSETKIRETRREGTFEEWPWLRYELEIEKLENLPFGDLELEDLFRVDVVVKWRHQIDREIRLVQVVGAEGDFS